MIVTVLCVRTFVVEGYMISTGSMAPGLLGYHKRVVCPLCQTVFKLGVAFDEEEGFVSENPTYPTHCTCPNCGEDEIDIRTVPKTQGDQLLVLKNAFAVRDPDRWEVVVFRNPALATEAYVKRAIGLPGESVRIAEGDAFINGIRARKSLAQCEATQLTVYDDSRRPSDAGWRRRWAVGRAWQESMTGFQAHPSDEWSWVRYEHWLRTGGHHVTAVKVPREQLAAARRKFSIGDGLPFVVNDLVEFDLESAELIVRGVMTDELKAELLATSSDSTFRKAIGNLARSSHIAPISDDYGYNTKRPTEAVHDVGIRIRLSSDKRSGEFVVQMETPAGTVEVVLNLETGAAQLFGPGGPTLRTGSFAPSSLSVGAEIGIWQADRAVFATFNGEPLFDPWPLPAKTMRRLSARPVAFASRGAELAADHIRIVRDIHYTAGRARNGVNEEFLLGDEEYFVLGDNSPLSFDSRNWKEAAVHKNNLIGKPIVVHLPSSPKALRLGNDNYLIRLPDFSKIRYVR